MRACHFLIFSLLVCVSEPIRAQLPPIGNWREHLPYSQAIQVLNGTNHIWAATPLSVFSIDKAENSIDRYSKVNGLSETGISSIGWDEQTATLIIAYSNSNIDLVSNSTIKNLSAIKNSAQEGDKTINQVYTRNSLAYLSTNMGIIVIDIPRKEVKETYIIGGTGNKVKVYQVTADNTHLYAATEEGLKRALLNGSNLPDYRSWQNLSDGNLLPAGPTRGVTLFSDKVVVQKQDSLYVQNGGTWNLFYTDSWRINDVSVSSGKMLLSEVSGINARIVVVNVSGSAESVIQNGNFVVAPKQAILANNDYWIADSVSGLARYTNNSFQSYVPNSPKAISNGQMVAMNKTLWVTAGSVTANWQPTNNKNGFYRLNTDGWKNYNRSSFAMLDSFPDFISVATDPRDGTAWIGSYGGGLLSIDGSDRITPYKQNSPLQPAFFAPGSYRVSGLAFDGQNNLWITNYGAPQNVHVRKNDGTWRSFNTPFALGENALSTIVIDDLDQKWIIAPNGQGLICFNHGASIDNAADDRWRLFRTGKGNGNLPNDFVLSIAKDKNSFIWIGTRQGIGIVQCPQEVFSAQGCEALLPVVQQDNFAGYLFRDEEVQAIAVDGADRKWIGTRNGVWLISADGEKTIYRFTTDDSPLPDNDVTHIAIDGSSGEVFFSTAKGMVSFRSTATDAGSSGISPLVYPNPVPPGYTGTIAIKGLPENATVKITELDGRLVYQTQALGGQATWNGKNYKGQRIATGVYLVLVVDSNKKEKIATKIVFVSK